MEVAIVIKYDIATPEASFGGVFLLKYGFTPLGCLLQRTLMLVDADCAPIKQN